MKKIISKILITCLLLQLYGCYSTDYVTLNDLQNADENDKIILVTKDKKEYTLNNNDPRINSSEWKIEKDGVLLVTKELARRKDKLGQEVVKKNSEVKYENIASISIEKFSLIKTALLIVGIAGLVFVIFAASNDFSLYSK